MRLCFLTCDGDPEDSKPFSEPKVEASEDEDGTSAISVKKETPEAHPPPMLKFERVPGPSTSTDGRKRKHDGDSDAFSNAEFAGTETDDNIDAAPRQIQKKSKVTQDSRVISAKDASAATAGIDTEDLRREIKRIKQNKLSETVNLIVDCLWNPFSDQDPALNRLAGKMLKKLSLDDLNFCQRALCAGRYVPELNKSLGICKAHSRDA